MDTKKSLLSFHVVPKSENSSEALEKARERAHTQRCLQIVASELAILEKCHGNGFRCMRCRLVVSPQYKRYNNKCPYCRHGRFEPAQVNQSMMVDAMERWRVDPDTRRSAQWQVDDTDLVPWVARYQQLYGN